VSVPATEQVRKSARRLGDTYTENASLSAGGHPVPLNPEEEKRACDIGSTSIAPRQHKEMEKIPLVTEQQNPYDKRTREGTRGELSEGQDHTEYPFAHTL
jgi:hypothetical protein